MVASLLSKHEPIDVTSIDANGRAWLSSKRGSDGHAQQHHYESASDRAKLGSNVSAGRLTELCSHDELSTDMHTIADDVSYCQHGSDGAASADIDINANDHIDRHALDFAKLHTIGRSGGRGYICASRSSKH